MLMIDLLWKRLLLHGCSDENTDKDLFTLSEVDFSLNGGETLLVSSTL